MYAHQPGSQPLDIPEAIPNPAVPQPTPAPSPAPKDPGKAPPPLRAAGSRHTPHPKPMELSSHHSLHLHDWPFATADKMSWSDIAAAHNRLVVGSSPTSSTTHSRAT